MEIITGIDMGLKCTGMVKASKDGEKTWFSKAFILKGKLVKEAKYISFIKSFIVDGEIAKAIKDSDLLCIEKPFNIMGHGRVLLELLGIIKYFCIKHNTPFIEIPQMTLKKFATGKGNAQKSEMVVQALKEFSFEAGTEDEVDAFWCVQIGLCLRYPQYFKKARIEAAKKLKVIEIDR